MTAPGTGPGRRSPVAITGADVFRENNPNIPYTTEEIADSTIEAAGAGATVAHLHVREDDGTPSGRPELFVDAIDRIRAGCDDPDDGLDRRRQRHDDRGAHDRPRGEARHLGRRVGLDELRRRDLHHAAARRPRDRRARARGWGSRSRSRPSTSATWSARCAGSSRASSTPPLRINLVFGVPGGIDASPEALDAMLRPLPPRAPSGPSPASAATTSACSALALLRGRAGDPHRPRGRRLHQPRACTRRRTPPWSRWPSASPRTLGREVADPGPDRGAARAWLSPPRPWPGRPPGATRPAGAAPRPARRSTAPRSSCSHGSATTPPRCGRSPRRPSAAGGDLPLVPSKEAILVRLQDDFMERLTERVVAAMERQDAPGAAARRRRPRARRLSTACTAQEAFVTDSEIRALSASPARGADRQARRLPGDLQRDDRGGVRDGSLRCSDAARRHLRDPAPVHRGRPLVRSRRAARAGAGRRACTSSSCSARCGPRPKLIAEAIEAVSGSAEGG